MGGAKHKMTAAELERIHDEHVAAMFRHGLVVLRDETATRDVLQDVFLKLAEGKVDLEAVGNERSYLLKMVHHAALDLIRRRQVRQDHVKRRTGECAALFETQQDPDREAYRQRMEEALATLPDEQRVVIVLKLWQELTFEEISEICSIPLNTAASRYRYGLDKIRALLRPLYEEL